MAEGIIFDIKKYAVHDGPGIRTTIFFKGCPLRCGWCHNPEGIDPDPELSFRSGRCLEDCRACLPACPEGAVSRTESGIRISSRLCRRHGFCADACPTEALKLIGRRMTSAEVMAEIEKDRIFYDNSRGGATFSGGEPLMQPEFLRNLLKSCRERGIPTVVDTSGHAPYRQLERIRPLTDLFLFDIKHMDDARHKAATGVSNRLILDNLIRLSRSGAPIEIRFPVIPGFNDDDDHIRNLIEFLRDRSGIRGIGLLPYHKIGSQKYADLRRPRTGPELIPLPETAVRGIRTMLTDAGFEVTVGG